MYVFREGRRLVSAESLRSDLAKSLGCLLRLANPSDRHAKSLALESLLRAGELECALADCADSAKEPGAITDALAAELFSERPATYGALLALLEALPLPPQVTLCVSEGFAYYALHPIQYARLLESLDTSAKAVAVVGIRSIGTTLSAVVKAAAEKRGVAAERITVRPQGHPFDRVTHFSSEQRDWVTRQLAKGAHFLVVDEGPGLSGSSFLSTAEALVAVGVAQESMTLLCAHQPNLQALCTCDAETRAQRFVWRAVPPNPELPEDAGAYIGGGRWREQFTGRPDIWPASWTSMERAKFLSQDGRRLYKFEGLGHYGSAVHARACTLQEAGFSPNMAAPLDGTGYASHSLILGGNLNRTQITADVVEGMARYCAFRAREMRCAEPTSCQSNSEGLALMVHTNFVEEFGSPPDIEPTFTVEQPVIADGRMQPWEWAVQGNRLLKFDAVSHGDDHFFPGPADIAWDLAGAIVEFFLCGQTDITGPLLEGYKKYSGDNATSRLPAYLQAYSAFRMGYCRMAANALRGSEEEPRLRREYLLYREYAAKFLPCRVAA